MKPYNYLVLLFLPSLVVIGYFAGGGWNLLTPFCCFVLHPLASSLTQKKRSSTAPGKIAALTPSAGAIDPRAIPLLLGSVLLILFIWSLSRAGAMNAFAFVCFAIATGSVNGVIGFTLAHEFIHRRRGPERAGGMILLLINNYLHYKIEHIGGHHLYACTDKDPHTARIGESFYRFLPRTIATTYIRAWEIGTTRGARRKAKHIRTGRINFAPGCFGNRMFFYTLLQWCWWAAILAIFGAPGLLFCFLQSAVAIALLHMINYLQHYGLSRKEIAMGKFERMAPQHSWNSGHPQAAFNLFQLEKHADHHMHPHHPYDELTHHEESPGLPGGYTSMIVLALIPPLWFSMINKQIPLTQQTPHHGIYH
jgi:alkane 1-monooxygenase